MRTDGKTDEQISGQTDGRANRQTDMTKFIFVFCSFGKAPNNEFILQFVDANMNRFPQSPFFCLCFISTPLLYLRHLTGAERGISCLNLHRLHEGH
jgi:hypothetical protein